MKLDSTNLFLAVMALAMFSVVCVLALILWISSSPDPPEGECDPLSLTPECDEGFFCNENGRCTPDVIALPRPGRRRCKPGMAMSACDDCLFPLVERDGVCDEPPEGDVCAHPQVRALLDELVRKCSSVVAGQLGDCPPGVVAALVLDRQAEILEIAAAFSDLSFTVHFDINTPRPGRVGTWPTTAERERLREDLRAHLAGAREGYLLLVAIASHTGSKDQNFGLASRRSDAVVAMIGEARGDYPGFDAQLRDVRYLPGLVGDRHAPLDVATFDAHWGRSRRYLTWDDASARRLADDLVAAREDRLDPREAGWLSRTLNQAILVVPLPCRPALAGAPGAPAPPIRPALPPPEDLG